MAHRREEGQFGSGSQKKYKGVRMRRWGKWVSEIRIPNSRAKIWLGSYPSAEQAAHAYDLAALCLRGSVSSLNLPHSQVTVPESLSPRSIQAFASSRASEPPLPTIILDHPPPQLSPSNTPSPSPSPSPPSSPSPSACSSSCSSSRFPSPSPSLQTIQEDGIAMGLDSGCSIDDHMCYFVDLEPLGFIPTSSLITTSHALEFLFDSSSSIDIPLWSS